MEQRPQTVFRLSALFGELDSMFFWFIFSFTSIALFCLLDFDLLASEVGVENMKWSIKRFESRGK